MAFKRGIVAFAFGAPAELTSNQRVAEIAETWSGLYGGASVYTQADVPIAPGRDRKVVRIREVPGEPPPTLRIARGASEWAKWRQLDELWIACATPHLWRCERDLRYALSENGSLIDVGICPEVIREPYDWFCPESTQERTRTEKAWRKRERILEWTPMFIYTRLAS
jgi:hypothetical protein